MSICDTTLVQDWKLVSTCDHATLFSQGLNVPIFRTKNKSLFYLFLHLAGIDNKDNIVNSDAT